MSRMKNFKLVVGGFIVGAIFFSGASYAANNSVKLDAFLGVKLIQNGIDKTPEDKKPFIVNGTTYVPLRTAGELIGVDVTWDGKNSAVIIGKKIEGTPLPNPTNIFKKPNYIEASIGQNQKMTINEKSYGNKGQIIEANTSDHMSTDIVATFSYELNGQYTSLTLGVGMDDESYGDPTRTLTFRDQDGNILRQVTIGNGSIEEGMEIDVKGVTRLDIEVTNLNDGLAVIDLISPTLSK